MREILKINLENEMDLILANKRTMKLAELCGLSLTVQTSLATAISEIARSALSKNQNAKLVLGITDVRGKNQLSAVITDTVKDVCKSAEALGLAKRLVNEVVIVSRGQLCDIHLSQELKLSAKVSDSRIQTFLDYFQEEPPVSPYDEIRRKNILLLQLAEKLQASENQYRELTDTLPLIMFLATPEGKVVYTNQWLKDYFTVPDVISDFFDKSLLHADDHEAISKEWKRTFNAGRPFQAQGRLKSKSDSHIWHLISIQPVKNENQEITQWSGFFVDIHAQKLIEETLKDNVELKETQDRLLDYQNRLEEKIKELNITNNELEQFAYIASHDLQEPLRKIITFSLLLSSKLPDMNPEHSIYFEKIISSSQRMTDLIRDVLDYSSVARIKLEHNDVDLNEIVEIILNDFELLIEQKQAVIQASTLPVIKGVKLQIMQLFSNLVSNALKFSDTKPVIKIAPRELLLKEVDFYELDLATPYVAINITDNGIGFDQKYADKIFKIFQRLNGRSAYSGTGIGLAICKKIMENHHGMISAISAPGEGTTFTIIFPNHSTAASADVSIALLDGSS